MESSEFQFSIKYLKILQLLTILTLLPSQASAKNKLGTFMDNQNQNLCQLVQVWNQNLFLVKIIFTLLMSLFYVVNSFDSLLE